MKVFETLVPSVARRAPRPAGGRAAQYSPQTLVCLVNVVKNIQYHVAFNSSMNFSNKKSKYNLIVFYLLRSIHFR